MEDHLKHVVNKADTIVPEYHGALDAWRGLLCILVAIYHTVWVSNVRELPLIHQGAVLIDLFFVMSGFLMYELYRDSLQTKDGAVSFLYRRFARIYPLHLVTLLVVVSLAICRVLLDSLGYAQQDPGEVLPFETGSEDSVAALVAHLLLVNSLGFFDSLSFNIPAWTISVEFYCYVLFAVWMYFCPPRRTRHTFVILAITACIYFGLSRVKSDMNFHYDLGIFRGAGGFLVGVLTCQLFLWTKKQLHRFSGARVGRVATLCEVLVVFATFGFVIYFPGKWQFVFAPFASAFIFIFALGLGKLSQLLCNPACLHLGKISYSVYLWHVTFIYLIDRVLVRIIVPFVGENWNANGYGGDLLLIPYLIFVLLVSHFSFLWIEQPARKLLLTLANSRRNLPSASSLDRSQGSTKALG